MLTLKLINEETERVVRGLEKKHFAGAAAAIEAVQATDRRRREAQQQLDQLLAESKRKAAEIGALMKKGQRAEADAAKADVAAMKERAKALDMAMNEAQHQLDEQLCQIPNIPYDEVPEGAAAADNLVVATSLCQPDGAPQLPVTVAQFATAYATALPAVAGSAEGGALPHWELARKYNLIDFDLGVKITGAGFPVYIGKGARLQRALINFFLDEARRAGYTEIMPPTVVNADSGYGTGQLPDKEGQMYHAEVDDFYLIPTAEVPVTNIYRDVILNEHDLPIKNCAYTQCFRREAGSYGKDVRGLNRLHEFSKVEIVRIDTPEHSRESHKEMLAYVESLLQKLELPYRILRLCGGDQSFTSAICYDFEVYSEAQQRWLEVSSVSNFDTYQANRLKCRYRPEGSKKTELCHTLNGSALALPRIVAALLENNQRPDGIHMPAALQPYTGYEVID
ncbi:MAG: serine--tRNA ligase [Bacteroidaceae bacterium]|nr:serine--tRNA ligase [Bacteroidaceae bacterium]